MPLLRVPGLPAPALVVGSAAPDLIYLVGTLGAAAHRPGGILIICLPAGLLAFLYVEGLVLPVVGPLLVSAWPLRGRGTVARLVGPRGVPRTVGGWGAVAGAVVLGAATHQVWDGFTHAWLWPANVLYPEATVALFGQPVLVARVVQHASSVVGLIVVCVYLWCTAPVSPVRVERPGARRQLMILLAAPIAGACVAAALRWRVPDPLITRALWNAAWVGVAWFAGLLGVVCLLARIGRGSRSRPG